MFASKSSPEFSVPKQYISWISDNKLTWTMKSGGVGADTAVEISARPISQEPMVCLYFMFALKKFLTYVPHVTLSISS